MDRIDPLDYSHRDAATVASEWGRHGLFRDVQDLGTTSVRGRRSGRNLTQVRLVFDDVILDEHVLWYAEDEIYWLAGRPATFSIRFRPAREGGLVGFDLLKQAEYRAELLEGEAQLAVTVGGQVTIASRERQ